MALRLPEVRFTRDNVLGPVCSITVGKRRVGLCICHHLPERSIRFFGLEHYLCSRCLGILFGWGTGLVAGFIFGITLALPVAVFLLVPMVMDGLSQAWGMRDSTNMIRVITGFAAGFALNGL